MRHPASVPAFSSRATSSATPVRYGNDRHAGPSSAATGRSLATNIRDLVLIALAWAIFIGIMMYPAAQIAGILICAIALLIGSTRRATPSLAAI